MCSGDVLGSRTGLHHSSPARPPAVRRGNTQCEKYPTPILRFRNMADPAKIGMRRTRFECGRPLAENAEAASSANPPYVDIPRILRRRRRIFHAVPSASWRSMRSRIEGFELAAGLHRPGELIAQPPHACARPPTGAGPSDALVRYRGRLRHDRDDFGCSSALCIRVDNQQPRFHWRLMFAMSGRVSVQY